MTGSKSLEPEERETIISWCDADDKIHIYTTQRRIMTELKHNPQFELTKTIKNRFYRLNPLGLCGFLPLNAITIRKTSKKGKKPKNFDVQRFKKKKS